MDELQWKEAKRPRNWPSLAIFLLITVNVMQSVNGQAIKPVEENSSPSHINAAKGSSVWLHWNYTYVGDGRQGIVLLAYREQVVGFRTVSNSSIQPLAKRIGQSGALTLESSIPAPFNRRVEVISSNSTLVIHNLQYNDSAYQFLSVVEMSIDGGYAFYNLKPVVTLKVNGHTLDKKTSTGVNFGASITVLIMSINCFIF